MPRPRGHLAQYVEYFVSNEFCHMGRKLEGNLLSGRRYHRQKNALSHRGWQYASPRYGLHDDGLDSDDGD